MGRPADRILASTFSAVAGSSYTSTAGGARIARVGGPKCGRWRDEFRNGKRVKEGGLLTVAGFQNGYLGDPRLVQ